MLCDVFSAKCMPLTTLGLDVDLLIQSGFGSAERVFVRSYLLQKFSHFTYHSGHRC